MDCSVLFFSTFEVASDRAPHHLEVVGVMSRYNKQTVRMANWRQYALKIWAERCSLLDATQSCAIVRVVAIDALGHIHSGSDGGMIPKGGYYEVHKRAYTFNVKTKIYVRGARFRRRVCATRVSVAYSTCRK